MPRVNKILENVMLLTTPNNVRAKTVSRAQASGEPALFHKPHTKFRFYHRCPLSLPACISLCGKSRRQAGSLERVQAHTTLAVRCVRTCITRGRHMKTLFRTVCYLCFGQGNQARAGRGSVSMVQHPTQPVYVVCVGAIASSTGRTQPE